ncbi:hypothetical protein [Lichenicoccus sp.]|uniref:hypothetical protein n=1 Tax=Lichenicoccus sp. TaxID=2781899 RepID=UPI003D1383BA
MSAEQQPNIPYWHLWTDREGVSHQKRCALTDVQMKAMGQNTRDTDGRRGHRSGIIGDMPAVLMVVQLAAEPAVDQACRFI